MVKLTFIGAGGVRTPLVIESVLAFQSIVPLDELCLMDIDPERLELMRMVSEIRLKDVKPEFTIDWTTDARQAIEGSDYIVMTFRQGGIASRVIDEQVPLKYGVLGQETTGPGGFAMALRTIPVILDYIEMIRELAPEAWLINFTNPAGIITEAATRVAGFKHVVGICDNPSAMQRGIAARLNVPPDRLFIEYYGLNHLGWISGVYLEGKNLVPELIQGVIDGETLPGLPFHPGLVEALGTIPNEYLLFYYYPRKSVENLLKAGQSRAQQIQPFNVELYHTLMQIREEGSDPELTLAAYTKYLDQRHGTYMTIETGEAHSTHAPPSEDDQLGESAEGYSGVALRLIHALQNDTAATTLILNVPNRGALQGMADDDVVEVTSYVRNGVIRPFAFGKLPDHALGLMKRVKSYERLTIQAAVEESYPIAVKALALHPLVPSYETAKSILDDYIVQHGEHFPRLQ